MEQPMILDDIFWQICQELTTEELKKMRRLSKHHNKIVSEMSWYKKVYVENETILRHIIDNYKFLNLNLYQNITDEGVKELKNCHILDLRYCQKITDSSIKELKNCHTLDLSHCQNITWKYQRIKKMSYIIFMEYERHKGMY